MAKTRGEGPSQGKLGRPGPGWRAVSPGSKGAVPRLSTEHEAGSRKVMGWYSPPRPAPGMTDRHRARRKH